MQNDLLESFTKFDLSIDCYKIVLTQEHPDTSKRVEYCGPGVIYQDGEDKFSVKLFCQNDVDYMHDLLKINRLRSGEIIRDEEFFVMKAYDMYGTVWESSSILPQLSGNIPESNFIASGKFNNLFTTRSNKIAAEKNELRLFYRGKLPIPINARTVTKKYIKDDPRGDSIEADVTQFDFGEFVFEIHVTDDWTIIWLATKNEIDYSMIQRVNESFHLVIGITQSWSVATIQDVTNTEMILKSFAMDTVRSRVQPPIALRALSANNSYWKLFERYFTYASNHPSDDWHPLYALIHKVVESGKASLEASCLTAPVAVEGVSKLFGCDSNNTQVKAQVAQVRAAMKTLQLDESFTNRLNGALGNMPRLRVDDILYNLAINNVIHEKLIVCWKHLRHPFAHSAELELNKAQRYINDLSSTIVLFYQLVFLIIEYEGEYTDYSTYNHPSAEFKIPSEPEMAYISKKTIENEVETAPKRANHTRSSRQQRRTRKRKVQRRLLHSVKMKKRARCLS